MQYVVCSIQYEVCSMEVLLMDKVKSFEDLNVWKKSHQLVLRIYKMTTDLPDEEKFGLVSQMRRAAVSIAANIAEGFKKRGLRDKVNFYNIAQASLSELKYYLILVRDLNYVSEFGDCKERIDEIGRMLTGLINSAPNYKNI
jgi:four helix bundle protein